MDKQKRQLFIDGLIIILSIFIAIYLVKSELIIKFVVLLKDLKWLGVILAGSLFTSVFTVAPAIALISILAITTHPIVLAVLGGMGAAFGDYIIFRFIKDRISEDINYLLSFQKGNKFIWFFKTKLFIFFTPFIAGLIIASPLPDELGVAMLGLSKIKNKTFLLLSFFANGVGIFLIAWAAKGLAGL
jgi:hypothetical protein